MVEALAAEAAIAEEAAAIRDEATELTPELFLALWPLLGKPIPAAFIQTVPPTKGKPYESTGIRSVQVQVDRMNAVLTPLWWWDEARYENDGRLAEVTVYVGSTHPSPERQTTVLLSRSSWGGVEQGSTAGNIRKGSYTNAAKLAFARIGPGHEVYVGATDLDPDVDRDLAEQAEGKSEPAGVGAEIAKQLVDRAWANPAAKAQLQLAASHTAERDIGDCRTKPKAIKAIATLTFGQAEKLDRWLTKKSDEGVEDDTETEGAADG